MCIRHRWILGSRAPLLLMVLALLTGCTVLRSPQPDDDCTALLRALQRATADVRDAQYAFLDDFPGLRSDRVLAALGPAASTPQAQRLWLQRLAARDREASAIERDNLPAARRAGLPTTERLDACRQQQVERLLREPQARQQAVAAARVPSDYRTWTRLLGLYPLARPVYARQIAAWQATAAAQPAPTDSAHWLAYRPSAGNAPAHSGAPLRHDALGLPQPDQAQQAFLFERHAPWLRIAQDSPADRLGTPLFARNGQRDFDDQNPTVYQRLGWSRLGQRWHLQLIYQFWFRARPPEHPLDLYSGELDGLIWRVTLDDAGNALLYDSIHPCGCWHALFLPADSPLRFRQPAGAEQRLARRLTLPGSQTPTLWLRGGDHALLWVDGRRPPFPAIGYLSAELDDLRRLPFPAGHRSLYDARGLVPGSQRLERWILWPSGVSSAGAMRQWGRHASAFVGQAQFDDPDLLDRYVPAPE